MLLMSQAFPLPPIHRAGWVFIAIFAGVTAVLSYFGWPAFFLGVLLTAWCTWFFRAPVRHTPVRPGLIVSPADGRVVLIQQVPPPHELGMGTEPRTRISIFLSVFDVHMNRIPVDGTITAAEYHFGKFLHASHDKASDDNERMALRIELTGSHPKTGQDLAVVQIAGLIARRIICDVKAGQSVRAGQHYGLIRFGSRVDLYLPHGVTPQVGIGQYVLGGETILADCARDEPARVVEAR
jgi:phosphatidylserine decarboxylase